MCDMESRVHPLYAHTGEIALRSEFRSATVAVRMSAEGKFVLTVIKVDHESQQK